MSNITKPSSWMMTVQAPRFSEEVKKVAPRHLTPARFVRIAITAATRSPNLAACDPQTVLQSLMSLARMGVEADGRRAYLLPFWNSKRNCFECQPLVSYMGLIELALRSGHYASITSHVVCVGDDFLWDRGEVVRHRVDFSSPRGDPYAAYAIATTKDGHRTYDVMSKAEILAVKKRSRAKDNGPWQTDEMEMWRKTAVRRLSKYLLMSDEFRDALEADEDERVTVDTSSTPEADPEPAAEEPALLTESVDEPPAPVPAPAPEPARAPVPAPPPPAPRMEGQAEEHQSFKGVLIEAVAEKHGEKNGRAWTRWTVTFSGGLTAATFSDTDGHMASNLHRQKKPADLTVRPGRNGLNLVLQSICPADEIPM